MPFPSRNRIGVLLGCTIGLVTCACTAQRNAEPPHDSLATTSFPLTIRVPRNTALIFHTDSREVAERVASAMKDVPNFYLRGRFPDPVNRRPVEFVRGEVSLQEVVALQTLVAKNIIPGNPEGSPCDGLLNQPSRQRLLTATMGTMGTMGIMEIAETTVIAAIMGIIQVVETTETTETTETMEIMETMTIRGKMELEITATTGTEVIGIVSRLRSRG